MSTSEPFLPAQPADDDSTDTSSESGRTESAAADSDIAAEDDILDARSAQQKDPPFRTPSAGERLSPDDLEND